jgi:uncharacterized protein DUF4082
MVSFYDAGDIPSIGFFNQAGGISLGVQMTLPAGTITAGRWFYPDQNAGALTWTLWNSAGTVQLATAAVDAVTQQVFATFTTGSVNLPLHVVAGTYWSVINTGGAYSAIPGFFSGGPVVRNGLTFVTSGFNVTVGSFPDTPSAASYLSDIVFTPDGTRVPDFMPFFG